jgi:hypothetical protein
MISAIIETSRTANNRMDLIFPAIFSLTFVDDIIASLCGVCGRFKIEKRPG